MELLRVTWARLRLPETGAVRGAGALVAQSAAMNGAGVSASVGTGALVAQSARIAGRGGQRVDIHFSVRTPSATTATREPGAMVSRPRIAEIRISIS